MSGRIPSHRRVLLIAGRHQSCQWQQSMPHWVSITSLADVVAGRSGVAVDISSLDLPQPGFSAITRLDMYSGFGHGALASCCSSVI